MAQLGLPAPSVTRTPKQALDEFISRDKEGNLDRILDGSVPEAPAVQQAEAKLLKARRDLAEAELNLRYCDIVSEIDGVVTSKNVNPGNNVAGRAEPDGRPVAHRDLGRCQFQGDSTRRTCA